MVLTIFCSLIGIGLIAVACHFLWRWYGTKRQYDLLERGFDRDRTAGLKEAKQAIKEIDGDLHRGRSGDHNVAQQRVASTSDDDSLASSGSVLRSLPAVIPPDEQFRKK